MRYCWTLCDVASFCLSDTHRASHNFFVYRVHLTCHTVLQVTVGSAVGAAVAVLYYCTIEALVLSKRPLVRTLMPPAAAISSADATANGKHKAV
jgi:heme O synthase-like polyprenyltransferase